MKQSLNQTQKSKGHNIALQTVSKKVIFEILTNPEFATIQEVKA